LYPCSSLTNQRTNHMQHSPSSETLQLIKKLPVIYRTRMFISELTRELGPYPKPHKNIHTQQSYFSLVLSSPLHLRLSSKFPYQNSVCITLPSYQCHMSCPSLFPPTSATCPAHHSSLPPVPHVLPILSYFISSSYRHLSYLDSIFFSAPQFEKT